MGNRDTVVIGGSMGSIGPLQAILRELPPDLRAAIAVVLHVPATSTGIFASIAAASGPLPVKKADDGETMVAGNVYVARPDSHLLIVDGSLKLGKGPRENMVRPSIDALFRSAALSRGSRTIGVILSGMLNDGASGLATVKAAGGIALVQAPTDAKASEMPLAALEATAVDLSAPATDLARAIVDYSNQPSGPDAPLPVNVRMEVEIATGSSSFADDRGPLGNVVPLSCPECGGVMSEVAGVRPLRFRCQVGHAYTAKTLISDQQPVDEAMRIALRIIEERAVLVDRMSREAIAVNRPGMAEIYSRRAAEYRDYANSLRGAILRGMEEQSLESDV